MIRVIIIVIVMVIVGVMIALMVMVTVVVMVMILVLMLDITININGFTWPETIASWMEEVTTSNLNETISKTKQPLTIRFRGGILLLKIHDVPGQLLASFVIPQSQNIF